MSHTRMTTDFFLLLESSPLLVFKFEFLSLLQHEYPIEYFDDAWYKCRTGRDDLLRSSKNG